MVGKKKSEISEMKEKDGLGLRLRNVFVHKQTEQQFQLQTSMHLTFLPFSYTNKKDS